MPLASDYPFLDVLWTIIVFFVWVGWIFLLVRTFIDVFRRKDASGFKKAMWVVFILFVPFIGVLAYIIANGQEMAERDFDTAQAQQAQFDSAVQAAAGGGSASEIEKAKALLDSGAITQDEFVALKQQALSGA